VVGGAGDGSNTLTFAEVGTADFVGTYLGDVALEAGTPFGIVDEGGLTTPFVGNDPGTAAVASGSIAGLVSFGADGPAVVAGHPEVVNGFQFVADAQAVLAAMDLSSHGSVIDHLTVTSNGTVLDGSTLTTSTTLEAFAHDGHEAFSLTLDGDGTWQFQLAAPLDNPAPPSGAGEDGTIIDFSQLVSALDYDGDAIPLVSGSFNVDVTDDVPVLTSGQVIAALDEGVLPDTAATASGSLQTLVSFGADGPAAAGFHLVDASTASNWIASLGLSSGGFAIDAATINGSTLTVVDANHDNVFTLTVNGDGAWAFTLLQPIDAPLSGPVTVDLSGLVQATDFDGDTVKLAADFHVDVLGGTAAGDILNGGQGNDLLIGGAGADILHGDLGADFLTGGDGNNVFQYFKPTEGGDTITDFNAFGGQADQIQVSASGFLGGLVANQSVASIFETSNSNAFTNSADRFHFDTANNGLYYSADGTTAHEVLLATVTNHTVTGADIHVAS
jgi:T1SS-143 domain-containing protein